MRRKGKSEAWRTVHLFKFSWSLMGLLKEVHGEELARDKLLRFLKAKAEKRAIHQALLGFYEGIMDVQKKFRR